MSHRGQACVLRLFRKGRIVYGHTLCARPRGNGSDKSEEPDTLEKVQHGHRTPGNVFILRPFDELRVNGLGFNCSSWQGSNGGIDYGHTLCARPRGNGSERAQEPDTLEKVQLRYCTLGI